MKEIPETSCSKNNLVHAWKDITSNLILTSNPPQYPPKQEQCQNCGLIKTYRRTFEEWLDYEIGALPPTTNSTIIDLSGNITTQSGSGTTFNPT